MRIFLNGEQTDIQNAENVAQLMERYRKPPQTVLIEHNGVALRPREWRERLLSDGDRIEIIQVVAGG
jgi:thiamine biosynthesis protein ThiS